MSVVSSTRPEAHAEGEQPGRRLDLLARLGELFPRLRILQLGLLQQIDARVHRPRIHGQRHAHGAPLVDDRGHGRLEDALGLPAHLLHEVVDVHQVAPGRVELDVRLVEPGDVRRVAGLDGRGQLGVELLVGHGRVLDVAFLEAGLLGELVHLLLLQLVGQRGEVRDVPEDELLGPLRVALGDHPPRRARHDRRPARCLQHLPPRHPHSTHRDLLWR